MAGTIQCWGRSRKDFGKIPSIVEIPNLIEVQKQSYEQFLQKEIAPERRDETGLQAVFKSVFPIQDYNGNAMLEFHSYHFGDPKYTVEECHDRGMTFAIPLKVTLRLVVFDHDKEAKTRTIREQRGQEVYLGELPLMTDKGTFIINGTERVVVSQLQRSAGVFFDDDKGKTLASGKPLYSARVIPYRGSWVEFDFDANDILHVRVDRRRKMLATAFLRAFWFLEKNNVILSDEEILGHFYEGEEVLGFEEGNAWVRLSPDAHEGVRVAEDVKPPRHREPLITAGKTLTAKLLEKLVEANVEKIAVRAESLVGRRTAARIVDAESGEVLVQTNTEIPSQMLSQIMGRRVAPFKLLVAVLPGMPTVKPADKKVDQSMYETLARDHFKNPDEALVEIYRRLRPGDPPTVESARALFRGMFMDPRRYDLARVGRFMINKKLQIEAPLGVGSAGPLPRAGGVRGARRPSDALRPDLPDRDAGRPEHRPDLVALDLRANERVRLHRDALPEGRPGTRHRRDRVPDGARGGAVRHRPGQRRDRPERPLRPGAGLGAQGRRVPHGPARRAALYGRDHAE